MAQLKDTIVNGNLTVSGSINGKASTAGTADNANKLNSNAGSTSQPVYFTGGKPSGITSISTSYGGTGATTAKDGFINLTNGLSDGTTPGDSELIAATNGTNNGWTYTFKELYDNYLSGKVGTGFGISKTNYGGKAATAGTADKANALHDTSWSSKPDRTWTPSYGASNSETDPYLVSWSDSDSKLKAAKASSLTVKHAGTAGSAGSAGSAGDSSKLGGQLPSYYRVSGQPIVSASGSNYIKFSNGLLIQWGDNLNGSVTLPLSYNNTNYRVTVGGHAQSFRNPWDQAPQANNLEPNKFYLAVPGGGNRGSWIAIGFVS